MNRIFLLLIMGSLFTQVSAQLVDTLTFNNQENNLTGFLFTPENSTIKVFPVVVVLHHASSGLHSDPIYKAVVEDLNAIDVAVFIYDRRGEGLSISMDSVTSYYELAQDAQAAIRTLKTIPIVDSTFIGLYGISQGCWIASMVTGLERNIKFNVLVSPSTISPSLQMDYAAAANLREYGFNKKSIKSAIALRNTIDDFYRSKNSYSFTAKKRKLSS